MKRSICDENFDLKRFLAQRDSVTGPFISLCVSRCLCVFPRYKYLTKAPLYFCRSSALYFNKKCVWLSGPHFAKSSYLSGAKTIALNNCFALHRPNTGGRSFLPCDFSVFKTKPNASKPRGSLLVVKQNRWKREEATSFKISFKIYWCYFGNPLPYTVTPLPGPFIVINIVQALLSVRSAEIQS